MAGSALEWPGADKGTIRERRELIRMIWALFVCYGESVTEEVL